jgi:hypothetical protein
MNDGKQEPMAASLTERPRRIARVEKNRAGELVVHFVDGDSPVVDAKLARYFPWSIPDAYISVRDDGGREVAVLKDLADLDAQSADVIRAELADKVFNPRITRILSHKREFGMTTIKAETDRGPVTFQMRERHDVRILSPTRALFRDMDGNTYELPDFYGLDAASRRHVFHYF